MRQRPPRSTRTDTLFPTRRSSDLPLRNHVFALRHNQCGRAQENLSRRLALMKTAVNGLDLLEPVEGRTLHARSEEHTSELQSLMRSSSAVFCLKKHTILYCCILTATSNNKTETRYKTLNHR